MFPRRLRLFAALAVSMSFTSLLQARDYYCYLPGAGGLSNYIEEEVSKELWAQEIPFVAFKITSKGDVKERAENFIALFERLIAIDPEARCHLVGFSMGGLVIRYAANHLSFQNAKGLLIPLSERLLTQTSISTPHYGTPLAAFLKSNYPGLKPGLEDLTEEALQSMNDPSSPDYSPALEHIPFYSYRTYIGGRDEVSGILGKIGFQYLAFALTAMGRSPLNDGIVPFESMGFGRVLADYRRPHEFMSHDDGAHPRAAEILADHWDFLKASLELVTD